MHNKNKIRVRDVYRFNNSKNEFIVTGLDTNKKRCTIEYTKVLDETSKATTLLFSFKHIIANTKLIKMRYELDDRFKGL